MLKGVPEKHTQRKKWKKNSVDELHIILENEVARKLKLENIVVFSPNGLLNRRVLKSKIDLESMILKLFDKPSFIDGNHFNFFYFE